MVGRVQKLFAYKHGSRVRTPISNRDLSSATPVREMARYQSENRGGTGKPKTGTCALRFSNASNVPGRALTKALGNGEEDCELLASEIVPSDLLGQSFSSVGRRQSAKVASQQGAKRADNYAMLILWQRNKQDRL